MSAAELLKHIEALPARERRKLMRALQKMDARAADVRASEHVQWPDVEARALRNTGNRLLPNLVLQEREESAF
jgi:hypothetical protein